MGERVEHETRPPSHLEIQAVRAWEELRSGPADPARIEVLKWRRASGRKTVYRLSGVGTAGTAVIAKRCRQAKVLIERTLYETVLPRMPMPTLRCFGSRVEPDGKYGWLFLEDAGEGGYSAFKEEHRRLAGRWLASLHTTSAGLEASGRLPDRGPGYFLQNLRSARERILGNLANPALGPDDHEVLGSIVSRCEALEGGWGRVESLCEGMPRVVVHGDFKEKNLRVRAGDAGDVLLPFDWACAGTGVPAVDLAQSPQSSPGFSGNPDLASYCEVVRESWPHIDSAAIMSWANLATIFRSLVAINWAALNLSQEWVEKPMIWLGVYRATLDRAMEQAGWSEPIGSVGPQDRGPARPWPCPGPRP